SEFTVANPAGAHAVMTVLPVFTTRHALRVPEPPVSTGVSPSSPVSGGAGGASTSPSKPPSNGVQVWGPASGSKSSGLQGIGPHSGFGVGVSEPMSITMASVSSPASASWKPGGPSSPTAAYEQPAAPASAAPDAPRSTAIAILQPARERGVSRY